MIPLHRPAVIESLVLIGGLLFIWATALTNIGVFAIDDYWSGVVTYLPASQHSTKGIIEAAGIRNPFSNLFLFAVARLGGMVGFTQPLAQYRFLLFILGTFSFSVFQTSIRLLFPPKEPGNDKPRLIAQLLFAFYFFMPFVFSRSMIESICSPWLLASGVAAQFYFDRRRFVYLAAAVFFITIASMFRVQAGLCALALLVLPIFCKKPKDLVPLSFLFFVFFVASGIPDWFLRGKLHESLMSYVGYNLKHADSYGIPPFWSFLSTLFLLTLPPALVIKLDWKKVKVRYQKYLPLVLFFVVFVLGHTVTRHKEERFLIPILPFFLILLALWIDLMKKSNAGTWRWWYLGTVNAALLLLTSFQTSQSNVLDFAKFLVNAPGINRVLSADFSLRYLFPAAFIGHPVILDVINEEQAVTASRNLTCGEVLTASSVALNSLLEKDSSLDVSGRFEPGFLEGVAVRLNPRQNYRRGAFTAYRKKKCG